MHNYPNVAQDSDQLSGLFLFLSFITAYRTNHIRADVDSAPSGPGSSYVGYQTGHITPATSPRGTRSFARDGDAEDRW